MKPMELARTVMDETIGRASAAKDVYVFEDVPLPCGWSATVAVRADGKVDGYMGVSPDGRCMIDGTGVHGTGRCIDDGFAVVKDITAFALALGEVQMKHEAHRAMRHSRARLFADVERFDVNDYLRSLSGRCDPAIAGQTQELIRNGVAPHDFTDSEVDAMANDVLANLDCTNESSADADWQDPSDEH